MHGTRRDKVSQFVLLSLSLACSGRIHNLGEEPLAGGRGAHAGGSLTSLPMGSALGGSITSLGAAGTLLGSNNIAGGLATDLGLGGADATIDPIPDSVPSTKFPALYAATICQAAADCCVAEGFESDVDACRVFYEGQWGDRLLKPRWEKYDSMEAARCIRATRAAATGCSIRSLIQVAQDACDSIAGGVVAPGESCLFDSECDQQLGPALCRATQCSEVTCNHRCTLPSQLGEAFCSDTCLRDNRGENTCLPDAFRDAGRQAVGFCWLHDGLVCGADRQCMTAPSIGEPCVGLTCREGATCDNGTCVASSSTGPCPNGNECPPSSYCDYERGRCTPYKSNGDRCAYGWECASGNCSAEVCSALTDYRGKRCGGILDCVSGDCPLTNGRCGEFRMASYALCSGS